MSNGLTIDVSGQDYDIDIVLDGTILNSLGSLPSFTTTERDALENVVEGTIIWNETTHRPNVWNGTVWCYITITAGA